MNAAFNPNPHLGNALIPVDIVLAPEWWARNGKITFDEDFFFHPARRVEVEKQQERILYEKWGRYGLGEYRNDNRPEIGAVHLAAGFLLSEMLGCKVNYQENHPPQVIPAGRDRLDLLPEQAFESKAFKNALKLAESLKSRHGYLTGDMNWGGILNLAMDLRGEQIFVDMMTDPEGVAVFFRQIAGVIERFVSWLQAETGSTSVSVNRTVQHLERPVMLHSECSHTMISEEDYEHFLLPFDQAWSSYRPYGIHYCGADPHRMAAAFAKVPHLDFLDVGWGGDIALLRKYLPRTFLNIRLSPVEIAQQSAGEINQTIARLVKESGNPYLTGVCCINMDDSVTDDRIDAIFETVEELRKEYRSAKG